MLAAALALTLASGPAEGPVLLPEHREDLELLAEDDRDVEKARQLFDAGVKAAADRRWDVAIRFFAESYRYAGRPGALYALGRAHRALYFDSGRDPVQLRLALLRFRQYTERDPEGSNRTNADNYIAELEPYAKVLEGFAEDIVITRLMIHSPVDSATVSVDGGQEQPTPMTLDVEPGTHTVRVRAPGYDVATRSVSVPEGTTVPLEVALTEQPAALRVAGPKGATIYLDGDARGELPMPALPLRAGAHQLAVARAGRAPFIRELQLDRGESRSLDVDLPMTQQRKLAFAAFGLAGGSLVAAATLTGLALTAQGRAIDIRREREAVGISTARFVEGQDAWRRRNGLRTGAIVTGVVGGALLVAAIVLYLTDRPRLGDRLFRPEAAR